MGNPVKPVAKEGKMNAVAGKEPRSGAEAPAAKGKNAQVGQEKKADMKGGILGQPEDHNPLKGAVKELHSQHPQKHSDHGPHHGTNDHVRHEPLHGMRPRT